MKRGLIKARKCRLKQCGAAFTPTTEWNYFHTEKCRKTYNNRKRAALVAKALKSLAANEKGAA